MIRSKASAAAEHRSTVGRDGRVKEIGTAVDTRYAPHTHALLTVYEADFRESLLSFGTEVVRKAEDRSPEPRAREFPAKSSLSLHAGDDRTRVSCGVVTGSPSDSPSLISWVHLGFWNALSVPLRQSHPSAGRVTGDGHLTPNWH